MEDEIEYISSQVRTDNKINFWYYQEFILTLMDYSRCGFDTTRYDKLVRTYRDELKEQLWPRKSTIIPIKLNLNSQ